MTIPGNSLVRDTEVLGPWGKFHFDWVATDDPGRIDKLVGV
jgi:hypothetical protein